MKKLALGAAAFTALSGLALAAFSLGDQAKVFVTGSAGISYDDNLLQTETGKLSDTIFTLSPGLDVEFGKAEANLFSVLSFQEEIKRYMDTSGLDSNLAKISLRSNFKRGMDTGKFNAGYTQTNQNTPVSGVPGLLRRNIFNAGGSGEWEVRQGKDRFGLGISYEDTDYNQTTLADSQIYTIPVNYYYEFNPKNFLSAGFSYRKADLHTPSTGAKTDYTDYKYNIGWRRDEDPKLTGTFNVGFNQRQPDVGKSESSFDVNANLSYKATASTGYTFGLSNDFGQSSVGVSQKTFRANLGVNHQIDQRWSADGQTSFSTTDYLGARRDDYWDAKVALRWIAFPKYGVTLEASYGYKNNSSNVAGSSYNGSILGLTASARY